MSASVHAGIPHPPGSRHPPGADTPLGADTRPPRSRHSPGPDTPTEQTPPGADTPLLRTVRILLECILVFQSVWKMPFYEIISLLISGFSFLDPPLSLTHIPRIDHVSILSSFLMDPNTNKQTDRQMDGGFLPVIKPAVS